MIVPRDRKEALDAVTSGKFITIKRTRVNGRITGRTVSFALIIHLLILVYSLGY